MKTFLAVLISLFSVSAFACPDLTGRYNCLIDDVLTFAVDNSGGQTIYTYTYKNAPPETYTTDGKTYQKNGYLFSGSCTEHTFIGVFQQGGKTTKYTYYLKVGSRQLVIVQDSGPEENQWTYFCRML